MKKFPKLFLLCVFISMFNSTNVLGQDFWQKIHFPNDNGISWIKSNASGELFCTTSSGVYKSTDDGITWKILGLDSIPTYYLEIDQRTGYIYVVQNNRQNIAYSTDNGVTWNETTLNSTSNIISIYSSKNKDLFAGAWGRIYKSPDCGESWQCVHKSDLSMMVTSIIESEDGILFAGVTGFMGGGGVYRSDDNGDNWEHVGLDNEYISCLQFNSDGILYAGSAGNYESGIGGFYKSSDLGDTWELLNEELLVESLVIDADNILYATTNYDFDSSGMFKSKDGGITWKRIISGMDDPRVFYITMASTGYLFVFGNSENNIFRSVEPVAAGSGVFETNYPLSLKAYPNPCTDYLQIDGIKNYSSAQIIITDIMGREVYNGNYTGSSINISNLVKGVYILNVKEDGKCGTYKIIKK